MLLTVKDAWRVDKALLDSAATRACDWCQGLACLWTEARTGEVLSTPQQPRDTGILGLHL